MIRKLSALSLAAFACSLACTAFAQTTVHFREGQRVDPSEVARILGQAAPGAIKTRSIRLLDETTSTAVPGSLAKMVATTPVASGPSEPARALSLPVRFDFGSSDISASARAQLDALAEGIKLLPEGRRILIEGHTDAVGSDDYNRQLSQRRAAAVKQYLVDVQGIDARALVETGVGRQRPIAGLDPYAPQNRRVQFQGL
jgi:outer membrane protein OmpA-like peptidoglycan-associated protein